MVGHGHPLEFAAEVYVLMEILCQPNMDNIATYSARISDTIPLGQCTSSQRNYIIEYGIDMIRDGNKPEFAAQVCAAMAILYQEGIERVLPASIALNGESLEEAVKTITFTGMDMRKTAEARLSTIMEQNGADFKIINWWASRFQRFGPWEGIACAVRYVLANQLTNEAGTRHYLFEDECIRCKYDYSVLVRNWKPKLLPSIAFYKAFTGIALHKIEIPWKVGNTITVQRGFFIKGMQEKYPPAEQWETLGGEIAGLPGKTIDSTSLGTPAHQFSSPPSRVVLELKKVPISRVFSVYFMSSSFCLDDMEFDTKEEKLNNQYVDEHEIVCDVSGIKGKVVWSRGQSYGEQSYG
jgi:hypothetical protein